MDSWTTRAPLYQNIPGSKDSRFKRLYILMAVSDLCEISFLFNSLKNLKYLDSSLELTFLGWTKIGRSDC